MPGKQRKEARVKECLTPGCDRPGDHCRSNCPSCYEQYRSAVAAGETTWAALVRKGVTAESHRPRSQAQKVLTSLSTKKK